MESRDMTTLKDLRVSRGATQSDIAGRLAMSQVGLSRIESRGDLSVSLLRSYIEALGGKLQLAAVFPDAKVSLSGLTSTETREELLALKNQKCYIHPMPEDHKLDEFVVRRVDEALVEMEKVSNSQHLDIPIRRVLEVIPKTASGLATIVLRGSLKWSAHQKLWSVVLA
jgi:transcriptional regulator with XRE-family HTH domain